MIKKSLAAVVLASSMLVVPAASPAHADVVVNNYQKSAEFRVTDGHYQYRRCFTLTWSSTNTGTHTMYWCHRWWNAPRWAWLQLKADNS